MGLFGKTVPKTAGEDYQKTLSDMTRTENPSYWRDPLIFSLRGMRDAISILIVFFVSHFGGWGVEYRKFSGVVYGRKGEGNFGEASSFQGHRFPPHHSAIHDSGENNIGEGGRLIGSRKLIYIY